MAFSSIENDEAGSVAWISCHCPLTVCEDQSRRSSQIFFGLICQSSLYGIVEFVDCERPDLTGRRKFKQRYELPEIQAEAFTVEETSSKSSLKVSR